MVIEMNRKQILHWLGESQGGGNYDWVSSAQQRQLGSYGGGFKEEWSWNWKHLKAMTDQQLLDLFNEINDLHA
jgi:hypothetical protein